MSNKIVVVSMVKNEEDIIESFVRHCFSFADEMIIVDHNSSDGTGRILAALKNEGLALHIHQYIKVELAHAEVMNELLHEAIQKNGADIVLPTDADEFLMSFDVTRSCRELLQQLDINYVYLLHWWKCEPVYPEKDQDKFILSRPCYRTQNFDSSQKAIVGRRIAEMVPFEKGVNWKLRLVQGCHYAYWESEEGEKADLNEQIYSKELCVAHFHWRSDEQYMSKIVVSWINNVAKYSMNTVVADYLKIYFDKIGKGEHIQPGDVMRDKTLFDFSPYCDDQQIRYSSYVQKNVLRNLMAASEAMAESYAEEKLLKKKIGVSVILPYFGDNDSLRNTLGCLEKETYPYLDILICPCMNQEIIEPEECMKAYHGNGKIQYICAENTVAQRIASLGRYTNGAYVQWLLPGQKIIAGKIWKMLACIENFDYGEIACLIAVGKLQEEVPSLYYDFDIAVNMDVRRKNPFSELLQHGLPIAGGISAAIFQRKLMERCAWLSDAFVGNHVFELSIWEKIFSNVAGEYIAFLRECMACWSNQLLALENMIWYQFEVDICASKYQGTMEMSSKDREIKRKLLINREQIKELALSKGVINDLFLQYCAKILGVIA